MSKCLFHEVYVGGRGRGSGNDGASAQLMKYYLVGVGWGGVGVVVVEEQVALTGQQFFCRRKNPS